MAEGVDTAVNQSSSPQSDPAAVNEPAATDYSAMTVSELKDLARDRGLTGYSNMTKAELIALLSED